MVASLNRPASRRWNSLFGSARRRLSRIGELLSNAGRTERAEFEHLEQRQLLFALTITEPMIDPTTGVGTIRAFFGYAIPYLAPSAEPSEADPTIVEEDFGSDSPGIPGTGAAIVPQLFTWSSGFTVRHNMPIAGPTPGMRLVEETLDPEADNEILVNMQSGNQFTLSLSTFNVPVTSLQMTIRGGFNTANMVVELLFDNEVIAVLTGNDLAALGVPPAGAERRFTFEPPPGFTTFDQIRFSAAPGAPSMQFRIDDLTAVVPPRIYDDILEPRLFGVAVAFTGPLGATAEFFDLYDRPMRLTFAVGRPPNAEILLIDPDGDGIPNFNDGIGRIVMSNVNHRSALTLWGAELGASTTPPANVDAISQPDGVFWIRLPNNMAGFMDDFESAGMGFAYRADGPDFEVTGLPPASASLIIGSPFHRPQDAYNVAGPALQRIGVQTGPNFTVTGGFNRLNQGIFITDGSNMGSILAHAVLFGSSQFHGFVERMSFGPVPGSITVQGDLGSLHIAGDAGLWVDDEGSAPNGASIIQTNGHLFVGRTLGSVNISARSLMNITVLGDLDSNRASRDVLRYYEREFLTNVLAPNTTIHVIRNILNNNAAAARNDVLGEFGFFFARVDQAIPVGESTLRNDTIMGAEYVGSIGTAVQIFGDLGRRDVVSPLADPTDVYGFAVDGSQEVLIQLDGTIFSNLLGVYMRIVDADGRTVAAPQATVERRSSVSMRFQPDGPGIYYLVVQNTGWRSATNADPMSYVINMTGLAPTTFGAYRVGAGSGGPPQTGTSNSINVLSGSMGAVMIDTGLVGGNGQPTDVEAIMNIGESDDPLPPWLGLRSSSFTIASHLYNVVTGYSIVGTFISPVTFNIGGNLGKLRTGQIDPNSTGEIGDLRFARINTGGSIGLLDIRASIGLNTQADQPRPIDGPSTVQIRTGTNPHLKGDIGFIRVGGHVGGDTLMVQTANNSTVGGFVVSQDIGFSEEDEDYGIYAIGGLANGVMFNLGSNSDLRFFDAPRIDQFQILDYTIPIPTIGPGLELTDDAGGRVRISIVGGNGLASGFVRVLTVSQSLGMAIGRIQVDLTGGASLQITSLGTQGNQHVVSIGRISVRGSEDASAIRITGPTQVDVWRIVHEESEGFNEIVNTTPRGDIVAIDMDVLNRVQIGTGNLGRTQVPSWGPQLIGPFLGIVRGGSADVGGPIPLPGAAMTSFWTQGMYRPVTQSLFGIPPSSWLDDVGSPIDPYLNGVIVRSGDLASVDVGGAVGDVLVPSGTISNVVANADMVTPMGEFHGIVGNIYGVRISRVDIGDGLAPRARSNPFATTGIVALDDINLVLGTRIPGANIASNIMAANITPNNADPATFPIDGISRIELRGGGHYINAYISATPLDDFWTSFRAPDDGSYTGTIDQILGLNANFMRSEVRALDLNTLRMTNGFYDASVVHIAGTIQRVEAAGFRNSTIGGGEVEFHENRILAAVDLNILTTTGRTGDISDLAVDVGRRIGEVSARNIIRSRIDADSEIVRLETVQDLRSSEIVTGMLTSAIHRNIRSSAISVAGPLIAMTVNDSITNTDISVTGPDGRIDNITVTHLLSGSISSAGPIGTIRVTQGDMIASIKTFANLRGIEGNINLLSAGRDLDIRTDVSGTINQLVAGRHIGNRVNPSIILVRGNIQTVSLPNGQLYSDLRIGGTVTNVTIGTAVNRPANSNVGEGSIIAFGRIENVTVNGDFGGDIISYSGGIGVITINNGSFLPGARIAAYDGTLNNIVINSGNLYGDVHADYHILSIRLNGSADGVFGHVGINPNYSAGTAYSPTRNQHPPGVIATGAIQGPRITAGHNLGRLILPNGSIFEAFIHAGRAIGTIEVQGDIRNDTMTTGYGTVIAAGSSIFTIRAFGNVTDTMILVGVRDFGQNGRPGGTGANADIVQSGRLTTVDIRGHASNVIVSAGMDPGADGMYNTSDDLVVLGISYVREVLVGGNVNNVSVYADSPTLTVSQGVMRAGHDFTHRDPDIHPGGAVGTQIPVSAGADTNAFTFTTTHGETGTIIFTGSGRAYWDADNNRVVLVNTSLFSTLRVTSDTNRLTDFKIVSNDNASMGSIRVDANMFGSSRIVVDAYVFEIVTRNLNDDSTIRVGMNVRNITTGHLNGGTIESLYWARDIVINGNFGTTADFDEAHILLLAAGNLTINGTNAALVNVDRDLISFTVNGAMNRAQFRSGSNVGSFSVGSLNESRVSVRNRLGPVTIAGNMNDTAIQAGGDLGSSVLPGESNSVSTGHIASVAIGGNLTRSSIVAGLLRGQDGFFGTTDDFLAPGLSTIGNVTIGGTANGSNLNTEQYRIAATGSMGTVTINGQPGASQGNFQIRRIETEPSPIQVLNLQSTVSSNIWTTWMYFNQAMNESTVAPALTVSEVRRDSEGLLTKITLTPNVDYTLTEFDSVNNRIGVVFARHVTDRRLDDATGEPGLLAGPGVYRFELSAETLRAAVVVAKLAGEFDGFGNLSRDFSGDTIVGDAGDKLESVILEDPSGRRVDFYGPVDLDLVLDNNYEPDGLPDPNEEYTVRGRIGDHPAHGGSFLVAGDTDIYKITLRAGQILRMGGMEGAASQASRLVLNGAGEVQSGITSSMVELASSFANFFDFTTTEHFLAKETGTYYIVITNHNQWSDLEVVPSVANQASGTVGEYSFTIEVFDDGKTGFNADTDSGNGAAIVNAPAPIVFAGPSGVFGTEDDRTEVIVGDFVFHLDPGPDGIRGTADDIVIGTNGDGIISRRVGDQLTTTVEAAIGPRGYTGVPSVATPDIDIYHLNNRQPIAPGQLITVKVKLTDLGSDLGSFSADSFNDFRGQVQFGVFDTTNATGIDDALLVFSPTDFMPIGGTPGQIASQGNSIYGFDERGDFYISFVTPGLIGGSSAQQATYAIYLQGVFNTDYELEITQSTTAQGFAIPRAKQNVFIETKGGFIDWLEAGGLTTQLSALNGGVLGFTGTINGRTVEQYIAENLVVNLQSVFDAAGVHVNISTNPSAFEFQDFSKVFLTSTTDPITIFNTNNFGYSSHSDPYNLDRNDESVIFLPSFATLGYTGAKTDVDNFILSLTAAVGRRIGEMVGLRMTTPQFNPFTRDIMSANSVQFVNFLGGDYGFADQARPLSNHFDVLGDTGFYLGYQHSLSLLQRFIPPR